MSDPRPTPDAKKKLITASSIARMAGNIASGMVPHISNLEDDKLRWIAERSVRLAYFINSEVEKCEQCR